MLEARALTKYYDHTRAVRNVSFTVNPGQILGYLGPNGAGKSTTVRMLTGMTEPSEGQIFYRGRSIHYDLPAYQSRIGYVPEEAHLYPHLTGREYLQLVGRLRSIPRRILDPKMDEFLRLFSLWHDRHTPLSSYSKGMRQKVLLSAALLHDPEILILDEPFSGLDVTSALMLRDLLKALADRGKIILYSSHVLEVVEKVCSQVVILRKGEVVAYDSIDRLRDLMSQPSLEGVFAQLAEVEDTGALANRILAAMGGQTPAAEPAPPDPPPDPPTNSAAERPGALERISGSVKDIPYAFRSLRGSPGFTAVALISLALGICIATCALSEMSGMVLRTLPGVDHPESLIALQTPTSYPHYERYRARADVFSAAFAYVAPVPFTVSLGGRTERAWGQLVTPSYFSALGVRPFRGAFFDPPPPGEVPAAVVSYRFWQEHLGADPSAIGKTLHLNSQPCTVIGVAPKDFLGASPLLFAADVWLPVSAGARLAPELAGGVMEKPDRAIFRVAGRLRPGITPARAEAELEAAARQVEQDYGEPARAAHDRRVTLVEGGKLLPLRKQDLPFFTSFLTLMAGLVMWIACANVATMMLARAAGRRREIAIRLALGASRARLIRQLLTESMLLAAAAAVPGFLASVWLMRLLSQVRMPLPIPVAFDFQPDGRVLLLMIGVTVLTGLAFGLAPALHATRAGLAPALKEGGNVRIGKRRLSLRNILMVSQLAGSLSLLVVLGLLSRGIRTTLGVDAGFNPANLQMVSLDPVRDGYSAERSAAFFDQLLKRVSGLRQVTNVALTETVPVTIPSGGVTVTASGTVAQEKLPRPVAPAVKHVVGRDYFETLGIPILLGRSFRREDETSQSTAVIVNEDLVRRFWNGASPIGREIEIGSGAIVPPKILPGSYDYRALSGGRHRFYRVVGVARNVPDGMVVQESRAAVYFPLRPADYAQPSAEGLTLLVRAAPGFDAVSAVRREVAAIDPNLATFNARSMTEQIHRFVAPLRMAAWTYGLVGIFGLVLASVGLAGVTAQSVTHRAREIGIRIALGAQGSDLLGLVMKEGLVLVAAGTSLGLGGAWAGTRFLAAMNSSVGKVTSTSTSDPTVLFGAPFLLAGLALAACYLPARCSTRIDPAISLRQE